MAALSIDQQSSSTDRLQGKTQDESVPYNAVGSLSKFFGDIVALIDDEVLIEDFEDLAALEICHVVAASSIIAGRNEKRSGLIITRLRPRAVEACQ